MPRKKSLKKEIDDLRTQVEALRMERQSEIPSDFQNPDTSVQNQLFTADELKDLNDATAMETDPSNLSRQVEEAIKNLTKSAENEIGERPIAAVASAFLLGLLLGRIGR